MTVIHIVSSVSRQAGGPARSVQGLVAAQCAAGIDAWLMTLRDLGDPWVSGITNYRCAKCPGAKGVRAAVEKVIDECHPDLIEVHSLWQTNLHQAVVAARAKGVPYILTPRGCLDVWSLRQKWLKKKIALLTYQGRDLRHAVAFHTTSDDESAQMRRLGYSQPIIQEPNGVNVPKELPPRQKMVPRRMLFLSRMHPKKGVKDLVRAWNVARPKDWVCELVYTAGYDTEHVYEAEVKKLIGEFGLTDRFVLTGAMDDDAKWKAYRRSDCFILPTYTENFGIVIAEALYAGIPVITTKGAPWADLIDRKCGWWVPVGDIAALASAICSVAASTDVQLSEMGTRGRQLIDEEYSWTKLAERMKTAYRDLI